MKLRISKTNIKYWICALSGIFSMNPYFVWETFCGGVFSYLVYLFYAASIFILIAEKKTQEYKKTNLIGVFLLCLIHLYICLFSFESIGIKGVVSSFIAYLNLGVFITRNSNVQKQVFERFVKLFLISLFPGMVYYLLESLGISLSIGTMYSINQLVYTDSAEFRGTSGYYKLYIGAVYRVNSNSRFSGIYDEAGLIGTVAALLLAAKRFDLKNSKECRWLLFYCILSFSFAGYILILTYFLMQWIRKSQWKLILGAIIGISALIFLINLETNNSLVNSIQRRFQINADGITIINNRETSTFEKGYKSFSEGTLGTKLFGFGKGSATKNRYINGSSIYKCALYDYGYIGFVLMVFTLIYLYKPRIKMMINDWDTFILLVLFFVSFYQRPGVFYMYYFIILYGGRAFLTINTEKMNNT